MIALPVRIASPASSLKPRSVLHPSEGFSRAREDAWDMCRVVQHHGGVEVSDCCFAFANAEPWLMASESLRFQFGPEYFEAVELGRNPP